MILKWKPPTIDWYEKSADFRLKMKMSFLSIWLSDYLSVYLTIDWRMPTIDSKERMPFLSAVHVLPFLSTIEASDACVNQYQYWSGKECSRGKDVVTFQSQFARLRDQSTTHFIRNTYCLSFFAVDCVEKQNLLGHWPPSEILSILIVAGRIVVVSHSSPPGLQSYMWHRAMLRASYTISFFSFLSLSDFSLPSCLFPFFLSFISFLSPSLPPPSLSLSLFHFPQPGCSWLYLQLHILGSVGTLPTVCGTICHRIDPRLAVEIILISIITIF